MYGGTVEQDIAYLRRDFERKHADLAKDIRALARDVVEGDSANADDIGDLLERVERLERAAEK